MPRQRLGKRLDLRPMLSQIACHLSSVDPITFAFIEGDSDIQDFLSGVILTCVDSIAKRA
nr:Uncharacterised protein [Klebsiella pneumoniae]